MSCEAAAALPGPGREPEKLTAAAMPRVLFLSKRAKWEAFCNVRKSAPKALDCFAAPVHALSRDNFAIRIVWTPASQSFAIVRGQGNLLLTAAAIACWQLS